MAQFVEHEPCPSCGSRDNLARYSDGGAYCFGCGRTEGSQFSRYVTDSVIKEPTVLKLPDDAAMEYPAVAMDWITKYGLNVEILLRNNVFWSDKRKQLLFTWWDKSDTSKNSQLLAYNARNFDSGPKYTTKGNITDLLPIYKCAIAGKHWKASTLVLVEDCLSAMKISNIVTDCMPCLRSGVSKEKIARLSYLYEKFVVWLDGDMYTNSMKIYDQLQFLNRECKVVNTTKDPKEYRYSDLSFYCKM